MQFTKEQLDAISVLSSVGYGQYSLSGPAGSGKTTVLKQLVESIGGDVEVCTPTNKAAQVLRSKGVVANTLYRIFFMPEEVVGPHGRWLKFTPCDEYGGGLPDGKRRFADTIIVDEASMLQTWVVAKLRRMCNRLILVGDPHQLPPVKDRTIPDGLFNTLEHDVSLKQIHRQKDGSDILGLATAIRTESPKVLSYLNSFRPEMSFEEACDLGYQFIGFTNKERSRINHIYRTRLGFQGILPQPGDRMISLDNVNDEVLNGTTFLCRAFHWDQAVDNGAYKERFGRITMEMEDGSVRDMKIDIELFLRDQLASQTKHFARFREREDDSVGLKCTFAYCMTAHKAQGSEYERVAVVDQRKVIHMMTQQAIAKGEQSMSADEMARRWLYTAVTRARTELIVVGQWWAVLEMCIAEAA